MSTRSRHSFRRQSGQAQRSQTSESSDTPQTTPSLTPSKSRRGQLLRRESSRVREAIGHFFEKFSHHDREHESRHGSRDTTFSDSHSVTKSSASASSKPPSVKGTTVLPSSAFIPYDLSSSPPMQTEEPVALGAALNEPGSSATPPGVTTPEAATDRGLITPPLSEIIEPSVSANIPNPISDSGVNVAFPTESTIPSTADSSSGPAESPPAHITDSTPDTVTVWPSAERHVRLSTETSVEVMIPREQEQYAEELHAKEAGSSKPDTLEQVHNSTIQTAPAADPPRSVDNTLVGRVSSLYQGVSSMVPSYSGLRELIFPTHSSTAVPTQSSSSSLVGYAFHGVIKPVILFTADWALLVLCYILIKMLRFRPDSVKTAMSMLPLELVLRLRRVFVRLSYRPHL